MLDASNARASKPAAVRGEQVELVCLVRIRRLDFDHKTVELRFGKRIGAFVLDRVLRRAEQKRLRQRIGNPVDRDAPFFHRLEQRRLRLRGRAVDLVGEHDVGDDRPGARLNCAVCGLKTVVPTTSEGIKSGVNAMRRNSRPSSSASARTASVLPVPGTPSIST